MFKRSLLSLVLVAGLACPVSASAVSLSESSEAATKAFHSVKNGLMTKAGQASNFFFVNHRTATLGTVGVAALAVAAFFAYSKFVANKAN